MQKQSYFDQAKQLYNKALSKYKVVDYNDLSARKQIDDLDHESERSEDEEPTQSDNEFVVQDEAEEGSEDYSEDESEEDSEEEVAYETQEESEEEVQQPPKKIKQNQEDKLKKLEDIISKSIQQHLSEEKLAKLFEHFQKKEEKSVEISKAAQVAPVENSTQSQQNGSTESKPSQ